MHIKRDFPQLRFSIAYITVRSVSYLKFCRATDRIAGLAWSIHSQFRDYIARLPDGAVSALDGAELLDTGEAFFPLDARHTTDQRLCFTGTLQFSGHRGMLAVTVRQPWLEMVEETSVMRIVDPFDPNLRMELVAVDMDADGSGETRLTEAGTDLFMGNYRADIAFDPVRIVWAGKE